MRSLLLIALLLMLVGFTTACDPIRTVRGTVHAAPTVQIEDDQRVYEKGEPIEGAQIEYSCGNLRIDSTDKDGQFEHQSIGYWQPDCLFRVSHLDYYPQTFRVDELCVSFRTVNCDFMNIEAELLPRGPESAHSVPSHQLDTQSVPPAEWPSPLPLYRQISPAEYIYFSFITQSMIFVYALPTRWIGGAYFMGGLWTLSGIYAAFLPTYFDGWQKAVAITPAIGLFSLATYNFVFANTHSPRRKFWTNVGGLNAVALSLGITVLALDWSREDHNSQSDSTFSTDLEFGFTGTGVQLRYRF